MPHITAPPTSELGSFASFWTPWTDVGFYPDKRPQTPTWQSLGQSDRAAPLLERSDFDLLGLARRPEEGEYLPSSEFI
jgi:hypothetical protein